MYINNAKRLYYMGLRDLLNNVLGDTMTKDHTSQTKN